MSDFPILLLGREPTISDAIRFACAVASGADGFNAYRQTRAQRRGESGIWTRAVGYEVHFEAFAPTREALEATIASYFEAYPHSSWRTYFEAISEIDSEFVARGWRYSKENWT